MIEKLVIWWMHATLSERIFASLGFTGVCVISVLSTIIGFWNYKIETCSTVGCLSQSVKMQRYRKNTDPCRDAYYYTCGNIDKVLDNEDNLSFLDMEAKQIMEVCSESIEKWENTLVKLTKRLYQVCVEVNERSKESTKRIIREVTAGVGGWPVLQGKKWNETQFDWKTATYKFRELGYMDDFFIKINVKRYLIQSDKTYVVEPVFADVEDHRYGVVNIDKTDILTDLAMLFGATNASEIAEEIQDVHKFQEVLQLTSIGFNRENLTSKIFSFYDYQENLDSFNLTDYIQNVVGPLAQINKNSLGSFLPPTVFNRWIHVISITPKRVVANYMMWKFVEKFLPYISPELQYYKLGLQKLQGREEFCLETIKDMGLLYVGQSMVHRKYVDYETTAALYALLDILKNELVNKLRNSEHFVSSNKEQVLKRIESVKFELVTMSGYKANDIYQNSILESINVEEPTLLQLLAQANRNTRTLEFAKIRNEPTQRMPKNDFTVPRYIEDTNTIEAVGLETRDYFDLTRPRYINYAVIGTMMSHAFGELLLSQEDTNITLTTLGKCYAGSTGEEDEVILLGSIGIAQQIAWSAYKKWVEAHNEELKISYLEVHDSPEAVFWWSSISTFCKPKTFHGLYSNRFIENPSKFATRTISHFDWFSRSFHCVQHEPMNLDNKCFTL